MLRLARRTDDAWVEWALAHLDEILLDHAHAEKKAAGMAVNLIFRYPEHGAILPRLSELAREELDHFERLLATLRARGIPFGRLKPSPYAGRLQEAVRSHEPGRLVDTLLCCAVIEARSTERFRLLAEGLRERDSSLAELYEELWRAEARHGSAYVELARRVAPAAEVRERLAAILAHEAQVLADAPRVPRLHN